MNVVGIVQARMGSERLPGKVLQDIKGRPMLEQVLARLGMAVELNKTVVATSNLASDDAIATLCNRLGVPVYRGSESDVLDRFYQAAIIYKADVIVRVTADCPLVDFEGIDVLVRELWQQQLDYVAYDSQQLPRGLTAEAFTFEVLQKTCARVQYPYEREHVTIHMYEHPESFRIKFMDPPAWLKSPEFRLTVDTKADLELIRKIYSALDSPILDLRKVMELLDSHPELAEINKHIQQKSPK